MATDQTQVRLSEGPPPSTPPQASFMGLPAELRLHIYEALWTRERKYTIHSENPGSQISQRSSSRSTNEEDKIRAALLCVNKQILHEAGSTLWTHKDLIITMTARNFYSTGDAGLWNWSDYMGTCERRDRKLDLTKSALWPRIQSRINNLAIQAGPGFKDVVCGIPFDSETFPNLKVLRLFIAMKAWYEWNNLVYFASTLVTMFSANASFKRVEIELTSGSHHIDNTNWVVRSGEFTAVFPQQKCEDHCDVLKEALLRETGVTERGLDVIVLWRGHHPDVAST